MKLRWTRPALRDLQQIGDYLAAEAGNAVAARLMDLVMDKTETLTRFPHAGRAGRVPGTRELVIDGTPWIVPYRVLGGEVQVLAVFHGARRWPPGFD